MPGRQLQTSYIFLQTSLFGFGTCKQVFFWCRQVIIFDIENNLFTHQKRLACTKKKRVSKFKKKTCLHQNGVGPASTTVGDHVGTMGAEHFCVPTRMNRSRCATIDWCIVRVHVWVVGHLLCWHTRALRTLETFSRQLSEVKPS